MALTSVLPFQSGYFSASAAQPAGTAAFAAPGVSTASRMAPRTALHEAAEVRRRTSFSLKNGFRICFLLRNCHGRAMLHVRKRTVWAGDGPGLSGDALIIGWADVTK